MKHSGKLIAALIVLCSCGNKPDLSVKAGNEPATPSVQRVAVAEVRRVSLVNELSLTAEFKPYEEVEVMAKVSGFVKKIYVDVGDRVKQGQLLATLEIPEMQDDITKNTATIERSQAELARAQQEVKRSETAHEIAHLSHTRLAAVMKSKPGLIAQQEIDNAQNRDLLAESQIAAAKSALVSAEQAVKMNEADAGRSKTMFEYTKVTAPFAGLVTKRYVDTGAMVQAGTSSHTQAIPVVRISQTQTLRLILPVPESVVPHIRIGETVSVRVETLNRDFQGRVARFSGSIQTATRTMETEVDVPNPQGLLVSGMYAEAVLRLDERKAAISVPLNAIDEDKGKRSVFVVTKDNSIEKRMVVLGLESSERVEVKSGLEEHEVVVVGSRTQLRVGQKVEPKRIEEKVTAQERRGQ